MANRSELDFMADVTNGGSPPVVICRSNERDEKINIWCEMMRFLERVFISYSLLTGREFFSTGGRVY